MLLIPRANGGLAAVSSRVAPLLPFAHTLQNWRKVCARIRKKMAFQVSGGPFCLFGLPILGRGFARDGQIRNGIPLLKFCLKESPVSKRPSTLACESYKTNDKDIQFNKIRVSDDLPAIPINKIRMFFLEDDEMLLLLDKDQLYPEEADPNLESTFAQYVIMKVSL